MTAVLPIPGPLGASCDVIAVCPALQAAGSAAGSLAGDAARSAASDAAAGIFHLVVARIDDAASFAVNRVLGLLFAPVSRLDLGAQWFADRLHAMVLVTGLLVFPLLVAATIGAVIRQDTGRLLRAWLVWLPVSAFLTACIIPLVGAALTASDEMTGVIVHSVDVHRVLATLLPSTLALGAGSSIIEAVVAVLVLAGAVVLWLELLVREAAIYVCVFFLPLVLAGLLWPATVHVVRRAVEILAALILAKFVVAAVLTLGISALGESNLSGSGIFSGVAILLFAAFAPMGVLRLVPVVEAAAIGHLEGRSRQPLRAAGDAATRLHRRLPALALLGGLASSGSGGGWAGGEGEASSGAPSASRRLPLDPGSGGGADPDGAGPGGPGPGGGGRPGGGHGRGSGSPGGSGRPAPAPVTPSGARPAAGSAGQRSAAATTAGLVDLAALDPADAPGGEAAELPGLDGGVEWTWPDMDAAPGGIPYDEGTPDAGRSATLRFPARRDPDRGAGGAGGPRT